MSLTSHLDNSHSPVYKFMREHFPDTRAIVRACNKELKNQPVIRPKEAIDWGLVGQAIDYRIRYYFGVTPFEQFVAHRGKLVLRNSIAYWIEKNFAPLSVLVQDELHENQDGLFERLILVDSISDNFFDNLSKLLEEISPVEKCLASDQESKLLRYCVVLACFEQIFRIGVHPRNQLFAVTRSSVSDLLDIADNVMINDLRALSRAFYEENSSLLFESREVILNPKFDGSLDVGGADADLIVDKCIIDIKTTTRASPMQGNTFYQLLGYVLLDYTDRYRIEGVGVYFPRQRKLVQWPLESLVRELALANKSTLSLSELRDQFRACLAVNNPTI